MKNRHRRIISCQSLKPCKKPFSNQTQRISQKIQYSRVAHTTINTQGLRGIDQMTCSYSFQDTGNQQQKQLFYKFLTASHLDWLPVYESMAQINTPNLLSFVKIGQNQQAIYSNRIIAHYIGLWVTSMGYKEKENRQKVISNVYLFFNENPSVEEVAGLMYDNLLQGYLPQQLQLKSLLEVCRRGWQYFSFLICRLIKIVKNANKLSNTILYRELEGAIENQNPNF